MSDPDPDDVRRETEQWLAVAHDDRQAALACLGATPPLMTVAAYHCQQAAEKLLKGFLVEAGADFGKTHDLERLGQGVIAAFPQLSERVSAVRDWTIWNYAYRYPMDEKPEPVPTRDTLRDAISTIDDLAACLRALATAMPKG